MRLAIFTTNIKENGGVVVSSAEDALGADFFLADKEVEKKPALMAKVQGLHARCAGLKVCKSLTWMEEMLTKRCVCVGLCLWLCRAREGGRV